MLAGVVPDEVSWPPVILVLLLCLCCVLLSDETPVVAFDPRDGLVDPRRDFDNDDNATVVPFLVWVYFFTAPTRLVDLLPKIALVAPLLSTILILLEIAEVAFSLSHCLLEIPLLAVLVTCLIEDYDGIC